MSLHVDDMEMIEELYSDKDDLELNEWETGFMDDLFIKFEEGRDFNTYLLSDKQAAKLLTIYQNNYV